ncbi:MAG TPA: energy transducer TonB [Terriglobia bacterium]
MASWQYALDSHEQLRRPLAFSAVGHVCLAAAALLGALLRGQAVLWGDGSSDGAATVRLVSAASVPLPAPTVATKNRVATENPGLHQPEPPKPPEPKPEAKPAPPDEKAIDLPARNAKVTPPPVKKEPPKVEPPPREEPRPPRREIARTGRASTPEPTRRPPAEDKQLGNEVPYGEGGPATGPYGIFQSEAGEGGVNVMGGSGDFGQRFSWYVSAIRNRISSNWLKATVDPTVRVAPRVYITFQILRDGRVVNPQLTSASGVPSLDRSALRAVYDSSPMPPLPPDYSGSNVAVEFWFDFRR